MNRDVAHGAMSPQADYGLDRGRLLSEADDIDLVIDIQARHEIGREYHVRVRGVPDERGIERLRKGIALDGERTAPATVEIHKVIESTSHGPDAILSMVIYEGRNRQVRRMCEAVGHPVRRLVRVRIGPLTDRRLPPGDWRELTPDEVRRLAVATTTTKRGRRKAPRYDRRA